VSHIDRPHLCALGYGCMVVVDGGRLGCDGHESILLTAEERAAIEDARGTDRFDDVAGGVIRRCLDATRLAQ